VRLDPTPARLGRYWRRPGDAPSGAQRDLRDPNISHFQLWSRKSLIVSAAAAVSMA
jgi:hypothetical protein